MNMGLSLLFIGLVWILDGIFHFYFYNPTESYKPWFLFSGDLHAIFMHSLLVVMFIVFGVVAAIKTIRIKRSREEILHKTQEYQLLAENSNDVIWKMDNRGRFLYVSPSVEKLRGYTPDEVKNQELHEVLTPQSLKTLDGLFNRLEQIIIENPGREPSVITELEQPCKDGSTVWTEASVTTVIGKDNRPEFFIGVSRDITDRKSKEKQIKQSESYYRLLAETSLDYILVHDTEGKIIYTNPSGLEASGYPEEELIGMHVTGILPPEHRGIVEKLRERRLQGDFKTYRYEIELLNSNGKRIPVEVSSAPILIDKTPISIIVSARDISERKEAEKQSQKVRQKIEKMNQELEEKVEERTYMLKEAYRELESFSYSVSHDLRAPLRHIDTFSGLLKKSMEENKNGNSSEYLDLILNSTSKMKQLIDSLLYLSKTGRQEVVRKKFSMSVVVDQVIREIEIEQDLNSIDWKIQSLDEEEYADIRLVRQVWYNLISNSIKFSRKKSRIVIEIGRVNRKGRKFWYIKDNGAGFDDRFKDKLFGVFQRLHEEEEFEGTGIGLATVKRIIDKHRGEIFAESSLGKGAGFYFYLS